jgi:hypothetical protein
MSIQHRRPAAGQWTAARVRRDALNEGSRWKRLSWWLLIVPALALFSFSLAAGAQTGKPDYASAAKELPKSKALVVIGPRDDGTLLGWLKSIYSSHELCSVTASQLERIASEYEVGQVTIAVDGAPVELVTVSGQGANDAELRALLGVPALNCRLVRRASVFYLPFDAHGS